MAIAGFLVPYRAALVVGAAAAFLFSAAQSAHALVGCPDDAGQERDKIVIGSVAELVDSVSTRLARALLASFEVRFEKAGAELGSEAVVIYCKDRQVHGINAYGEGVVDSLNDEQVLLEVGVKTDGDDILVQYVVVPIRHYQFYGQGNSEIRGYHEALYEESRISAGLQQLFKGNAELRLMAALALALRYEKLADGETDADRQRALIHRSRAFYCDAIGSAEAARPRGDFLGLPESEWQALLDFAQAGTQRLFQKATSNPQYLSSLTVVASERAGSPGLDSACVLQFAALADEGSR